MRQNQGEISLSRDRIYSLLQACSKKKDLAACRAVYSLMIKGGFDSIAVLGDHLIRLFASCGSLPDANHVFNQIAKPTVYTWNGIISAHIKLGKDNQALELYHKMQLVGFFPDKVTFSNILKACSSTKNIEKGRFTHSQIVIHGISLDVVMGGALVDFYAKLGTLEEASRMFHDLPHHDVVSWGAMMAGFLRHGHGYTSLVCFQHMRHEGMLPSKVIFLLGLKACASIGAIVQGMLIHDELNKVAVEPDMFLQSVLVDMYMKCGCLEEAQRMFERLDHRDLVLWSAMIGGYAQCQNGQPALELYQRMLQEGVSPDRVVFLCVLQACGIAGSVLEGRLLHDQIIRKGLESDVAIGNTLIDTYAKCGGLDQAHKLFRQLRDRDVVSWAAIISGYVQHGQGLHAFELFVKMQLEGIKPSKTVFSCILKACTNLAALQQGHLIHEQVIKLGLNDDPIIGNTLVYMYSKCSCLKEAHNMFGRLSNKDVVSWSALIAGYTEQGQGHRALKLLGTMQLEGLKPDKGIFLCSLNACGSVGALQQGKRIHHSLLSHGVELDTIAVSALVDMYIRCGALQDAHITFDGLRNPDVVLWSALIAGYCDHGQAPIALKLFERMQETAMEPDQITYLNVFRACCDLGAVEKARVLHCQIVGTQFDCDAVIGSTLIDLYIKCGSVEDACKVFNGLPNRDLVSWGAMISGYALHGNSKLANQCLKDMQQEGFKPNDVIFTGIFTACSHAGRLEDGCWYFKHMRDDFGILPSKGHYDCILDLLGRAGHLNQAADLLQTMPSPPNILGWTSLLAGCRTYGNTDVGRQCFAHAV